MISSFGEQFKIDENIFHDAFYEVARELEVTGGGFRQLREQLYKFEGNPRKQNEIAADFFEENVAGWKRYNKWLEDKRIENMEEMQEDLEEARELPLSSLLQNKTVPLLKKFYRTIAGRPTPGKRKAEIVSALEALLNEKGMTDKVLALERKRLERKIEKEHEVCSDKKEMAELFIHRVMMLASASRSKEGLVYLLRNTDMHPWLLFSAVNDSRTPEECLRLDGTVRRYNDPFWKAHPIPCERLFCRCGTILLSDRQAKKYR